MDKKSSLHVCKQLDDLEIDYEMIHHPVAHTTELADKYIEGIDGVRTKTLLLTNRKKTQYYMLIMDDEKRLDLKKFAEIVETGRIQFANDEGLMKKIGLPAGLVSVFGLEFNEEKDIKVYYDREIVDEERQSFHPHDNTKTIFLSTEGTFKYIESLGLEVQVIDL